MSRRKTDEAIRNSEYVTIGELVRLTGIRYSTLKYYTECGILPFFQEAQKLIRRYKKDSSIQRIDEIKILKDKGLSIEEIQSKLK